MEELWFIERNELLKQWSEQMASEPVVQYTQSRYYQDNPILKKSFEFALSIIDFTETLFEKKKFVIGQQLLKSGTSIGANIREAQNAESKADFIHKMKIALKEADETDYWLLLCQASGHYPDTTELLNELNVVLKILNKIVATSKQNLKSK
jgi:four helix bundle protein